MPFVTVRSVINASIGINELRIGVPESQHMIPGKTYVGRLPGHSRKAFVRKREYTSKPLSYLALVGAALSFGPDTIYESERRSKMTRWLRSMFGSDCYDDRPRRRRVYYKEGAYYGSSAGRTVTSTRQVCSSCGKFRSPSWSARHPLEYGEIPRSGQCRKCAGKSTSSEVSASTKKRRRLHRHHSHHSPSDCTDDLHSSYDSKDPCHLRQRYKSDSLGYIRPRSLVRSGSGERVKIVIQNEGAAPRTRVRTLSSSYEIVRVTRCVSVDRPVRRRVLRSASSDLLYMDDIVEEVLPKRRSLNRARARSRSSVRFVDELDEPCHRRRPKSLSSHNSEEEAVTSRPRSHSRRPRPVHFDGAADTQMDGASGDRCSPREETQGFGGNENIEGAKPTEGSQSRKSSSGAFTEVHTPIFNRNAHLPPKSSRSTSRAYANHLSRFGKRSRDLEGPCNSSEMPPDAVAISNLTDRAQAAFVDYGYELDSQFPSPPSVTFALPVPRPSRSSSLLRFPSKAPTKQARYNERSRRRTGPLSPAYSNDGVFTPVPCQISYGRLRHNSEPPSPPDSVQDPDTSLTSITPSVLDPYIPTTATTTADNPDHPDHLAYLLSTAHITPSSHHKVHDERRKWDDRRSIYDTPTMSSRHNRDPSYYDYAKSGSIVSSLDGGAEEGGDSSEADLEFANTDKLVGSMDGPTEEADEEFFYHDHLPVRRNAMHDIFDEEELEQRYYETEIGYEAEGKAHMKSLRRQKTM